MDSTFMNTITEFFMDPLRLTLIVAGVVVVLAIVIFGRRSRKPNELRYSSSSTKEFSFGNRLSEDALVDEEVIVLPSKKKKVETAVNREALTASPKVEDNYIPEHTEAFGPRSVSKIDVDENDELFRDPLNLAVEEKSESAITAEASPDTVSATNSVEEEPASDEEIVSHKKPAPREQFVVLYIVSTEDKLFSGADIVTVSRSLGLAFGKHNVFHYPAVSAETGQSKFCLVNMTSEGSFPPEGLADIETKGVSLIMRLPIVNGDGLTVFSNMLGVAQALARKLGGEILEQTRMPLTADVVTTLRSDIAHFEAEAKQQEPAVPQL